MDNRLEGARAKVQRAKERFRDLCALHGAFMGLNPYGIVIFQDPETSEQVICARVSRDVPTEWPGLIGDIIHNLRAALDYLAWQLVIAHGGTPNSGTQFPVFSTQKTNEAATANSKEHGKACDRSPRYSATMHE